MSLTDDASRINRVLRLIQISREDRPNDIKYRLDKPEVFCAPPPTVKSQLKHAAILYLEWLNTSTAVAVEEHL